MNIEIIDNVFENRVADYYCGHVIGAVIMLGGSLNTSSDGFSKAQCFNFGEGLEEIYFFSFGGGGGGLREQCVENKPTPILPSYSCSHDISLCFLTSLLLFLTSPPRLLVIRDLLLFER